MSLCCNNCTAVNCSKCCPPRQIDSCPPHDRRRIVNEFPVEPFMCSPEVCKIYGSHDRNDPPAAPYPRAKAKNRDAESLGSPVGLVKSSFSVKTIDAKGNDLHSLRFGTYLKAYANIYLTPEADWETESIDMIMNEGQKLFNESKSKQTNADIVLLDVYSDIESKISRTFDLHGYTFQIELNEKFTPNVPDDAQQPPSKQLKPLEDWPVQYARSALKQFFKKARYCLLKVTNWYLCIWRARGVYFILDVYGRRVNDFVSDREKGIAMLICVKSLGNVDYLLRTLSGLQKTDVCNMREFRVVKLMSPDGKTMSREYGKRLNEYEIVNNTYAYLKSALHLSLNPAERVRRRSAFPASVAALLASKIDHPATWDEKMLDKLICYGVYVCRNCWEQCIRGYGSPSLEDISRFPNKLKIGQYYISFKLTPQCCEGQWKCVPNYQHTELFVAIEELFNIGKVNMLIQLGVQFYALWKKSDYYYLFDAYRHRICWNLAIDDKYSTLRMFSTQESLFVTFQQLLLETNRSAKFYIHTMQVTLLESVYKDATGAVPTMGTLAGVAAGGDDDVKSLNDTICFEEDETQCLKELGEISDYEDEDMFGVPITLSSESESDVVEEAMEEEEGGGAKVNMEEVESSSSGDDHGKRRKKKRTKGDRDRSKSKRDKSAEKKKKGKKDKKEKDEDKDKKKKEKKEKPKKEKKKKEKPPKEEKEKVNKEKKEKKPKKEKESEDDKKKKKVKEEKETDDDKKKKEKPKEEPKKPEPEPKKEEPKKPEIKKEPEFELPPKPKSFDDNDKQRENARSQARNRANEGDRDQLSNKPNNYPGYAAEARNMAVVGSESGTYESICKLLRAGFKCADRIMTMTPWGNYVVFRGFSELETLYFLFDGCTCNVERFRHLDLNCGTAGLLCFQSLHDVITYMIDTRKMNPCLKKQRQRNVVDDICREFC